MEFNEPNQGLGRRDFLKAAAGSAVLAATAGARADEKAPGPLIHRNHQPDRMRYRTLGRTRFVSSRIIFGAGAAIGDQRGLRLLDRAFEAGINHFDLGSAAYYKGAEKAFADFYRAHRGDIWVTSKAPVHLQPGPVSVAQAQAAAKEWSGLLDQSLIDLKADYIDAYYIMMVDEPSLLRSEEMQSALAAAKASGKVGWVGISSHTNAEACFLEAISVGCYDVAMVAITPAGWYDPNLAGMVRGTRALKELRPVLDRARTIDMGLVGMKAARYVAPMSADGNGNTKAFDRFYGAKLASAELNPCQRAYAYVLEHGVDVVIADMQNFTHLEQDIAVARTSDTYFA